ncbi:hypothetical protein ADUPG1_001383, partial [Aduncisulcus paluster]
RKTVKGEEGNEEKGGKSIAMIGEKGIKPEVTDDSSPRQSPNINESTSIIVASLLSSLGSPSSTPIDVTNDSEQHDPHRKKENPKEDTSADLTSFGSKHTKKEEEDVSQCPLNSPNFLMQSLSSRSFSPVLNIPIAASYVYKGGRESGETKITWEIIDKKDDSAKDDHAIPVHKELVSPRSLHSSASLMFVPPPESLGKRIRLTILPVSCEGICGG